MERYLKSDSSIKNQSFLSIGFSLHYIEFHHFIKKVNRVNTMECNPFEFVKMPHIIFGPGKLNELYKIMPKYGRNILFVIGDRSLKQSSKWDEIISFVENTTLNYFQISITNEPSPIIIDTAAKEFRKKDIELVVGIGGGSVIDAGKAISAMIPKNNSIKNYLEEVGHKTHDGQKIPYIAIPTTSGTGSEATKNAVISEVGLKGFKKSLRHDNLVPNIAIVDPELIISCPPSISAMCGMDALTQLIEAYVSSKRSLITNALAFNGLKSMYDKLIPVCSVGASDINIRSAIAYGSLISGISLANAGLGIVHGLASSIGGLFNIPHGVICGTLLAEATKMNIKKLRELGSQGKGALRKYAEVGAIFRVNESAINSENFKNCAFLAEALEKLTEELKLDKLGKFGIKAEDVNRIVAITGIKNNPVALDQNDIKTIVLNRI